MAGSSYETVMRAAALSEEVYFGPKEFGDHFIRRGKFIAIRGTDDITDWWSNIHTERISGIHAGFLGAVNALHIGPVAEETIFTGHSRGGAMAEILAQLYNCRAITFGAPKTGAPAGKHIAFMAAGDVVPLLPLSYRRKGTTFYLHDGRITKNPSTARMLFDAVCRRGVQHRMANYLEQLNAISPGTIYDAIDDSMSSR